MTKVASKKPAWITLGVALFVHSLLLSLQTNHRIDTSFLRSAILDSLAPLERVVDRTLHATVSVWDRYFALIGVYDENRRLQAQVDALKMQLEKEHEDVLEAARIRKFVGLEDSRLGRPVVARIIGRDPTQTRQSFTIDKGRTSGLQPDAAVITPEGVVGRVIYAGNYSSVVQLVLDSQSAVGVLVLPNRRLGIVKGNGGPWLDLDYIDDDSELQTGQQLITSGDDRIYPKSLPVGVIASVGPRRGLFKTVRIKPNVDIGRLEEVICIAHKPKPVDSLPEHP